MSFTAMVRSDCLHMFFVKLKVFCLFLLSPALPPSYFVLFTPFCFFSPLTKSCVRVPGCVGLMAGSGDLPVME